MVCDGGDSPAMLERALTLADYERLRKEQVAARAGGRLVGVGLACYTEYTGLGSVAYRRRGITDIAGPEAATVVIDAKGNARRFLSFPSQGQGHATVAAQLLAAELGIPADSVTVCSVDTASSPAGSGTFASRGAVAQAGESVQKDDTEGSA
jgi:carbon-monoxide dehydrogenase large subunit